MLQPDHIQIQKWIGSTTHIASKIQMFAIESVLRMKLEKSLNQTW